MGTQRRERKGRANMTTTSQSLQTRLFIGGDFVDAADGATFATLNPATGEVIAEVAEAKAEDVDRAAVAAQAALHGPWGRMELTERAKIIRKVGELLEERVDDLAR